MNLDNMLIAFSISLLICTGTVRSTYHFLSGIDANTDSYYDQINTYTNLYNFAYATEYDNNDAPHDLKLPFKDFDRSSENRTLNFSGEILYDIINENKSVKQEFFNDVLFWTETFTKPIPNNNPKTNNLIFANKVAFRLFYLLHLTALCIRTKITTR